MAKEAGKGRRGVLKFLAGLGLGAGVVEIYERLYGIPLVERRFRGEIDYWIGEYRSAEAEIRRLNDQLDGLTLRLNRIQSELSNISLLETDYNTELKKAYEDLDVAIDGVKGVINKYRPILGSEALVVEDTMLDLLKKI